MAKKMTEGVLTELLMGKAGDMIDPYEYRYWHGLEKRQVLVFGSIEQDVFPVEVLLALEELDDGSGEPIEVLINTDGGDVLSALRFVELMDKIKTPVHIRVLNRCMSAGMLLLLGGKENPNVRVTCPKNAFGLLHPGSVGTSDSAAQAKDQMRFYQRLDSVIRDLVTTRTNITPRQYRERSREEWYMFGEEMLEKGFVDALD